MKSPHFFKYSVVCMLTTGALYSSPSPASPLTIDPPLDVQPLIPHWSEGMYSGPGTLTYRFLSANGKVLVAGENDSFTGAPEPPVHTYIWNVGDGQVTDIGALASGNRTRPYAISADGGVVTGTSAITSGSRDTQAFIWRRGQGMTALGTLTSDNSGYSTGQALSDDGRVVAGSASTDAGSSNAFIWHEGDSRMTGLGTLKSDNSGFSNALALSADGRVAGGLSDTDSGNIQAFIWREGDSKMTGLGTLKSDNTGASRASLLSGNGRVATGYATTDAGTSQTFVWHEGDSRITGLGTLKSDNTGTSNPTGLSADGRVIAGFATTDAGTSQAFIWHEGDSKMTGLGSLKSDNSGISYARTLSDDGRVVAGSAATDAGTSQAFVWHEGDSRMTGLGSLKSDNTGASAVDSVSADGTVLVGYADADAGISHLALWKVTWPGEKPVDPGEPEEPGEPGKPVDPGEPEKPTEPGEPEEPGEPPVIVKVDRDNSALAMLKTGQRATEVADLWRSGVERLASARCRIAERDYCLGAFTGPVSAGSSLQVTTGVYGAMKVPGTDRLTAGMAVGAGVYDRLPQGYDTRGSHLPGMAVYGGYAQSADGSGMNVDVSAALDRQDVSITRDTLGYTEAGRGDSRLSGFQGGVSAGYGLRAGRDTLVTPSVMLKYSAMSRDGYVESNDVAFPAVYGEMHDRTVSVVTGLGIRHALNERVELDGSAGVETVLSRSRQAFTGQIDYIGAFSTDEGGERRVMPQVGGGASVKLSDNALLHAGAGWQQSGYGHDAAYGDLSLSVRW